MRLVHFEFHPNNAWNIQNWFESSLSREGDCFLDFSWLRIAVVVMRVVHFEFHQKNTWNIHYWFKLSLSRETAILALISLIYSTIQLTSMKSALPHEGIAWQSIVKLNWSLVKPNKDNILFRTHLLIIYSTIKICHASCDQSVFKLIWLAVC